MVNEDVYMAVMRPAMMYRATKCHIHVCKA